MSDAAHEPSGVDCEASVDAAAREERRAGVDRRRGPSPLDPDELASVRPWRPPALGDARVAGRRAADRGPGCVGGILVGRRPPTDSVASGNAPDDAAGAAGADGADAPGAAAERALAAAHEAGYAAGEAAAREAIGAELAALARAFERETRLCADALEAELVELARAVAGCALRRRLDGDGDAALLGELAREGLEALSAATSAAGPAAVRLHPLDAARFAEGDLGPDARVVADPALGRGDCLIERGPSRIDAGVRARLEAVTLDTGVGDGAADADIAPDTAPHAAADTASDAGAPA